MDRLISIKNGIHSYDDIYKEIGKIIEVSTEWEQEFRELLVLAKIKISSNAVSGLHKMCNKLCKTGIIDEYEHKSLSKVIDRRNYMVHEFFLAAKEHSLEKIEEVLNGTFYVINEARDVVANKIDELKGIKFGRRPTIFDKDN